MSKKVCGLKRATPKMKYHHMNFVMDFRADLKERQNNVMTEGTREFYLSEIKRMMGANEGFHIWFDGIYKFRANDDMPTYEKKIRNKYYYLRSKNKKSKKVPTPEVRF